MDSKKLPFKSILSILLPGLLLTGLLFWKLTSKADLPALENTEAQNPVQNSTLMPEMASEPVSEANNDQDAAIEQQLDRVRQQQIQTKDLRVKLEQTDLELEQQKALAEINKLKKENMVAINEPTADGQNNLPEIKVDYIGGDAVKKEAIVSIGGTRYQVKEKSMPLADIQVVSISDSSVTLHLGAPHDLIETIEYKPE